MSKDCPDCKKAEEYKKYLGLSKQNMRNQDARKRVQPGSQSPRIKTAKRGV